MCRSVLRYEPAYCGSTDGIDYNIFINVNMERLLSAYRLTVSQINNVNIICSVERGINYEVWSNNNTEKISSGTVTGSAITVDFLPIYKKGYKNFSIRPAGAYELTVFYDLQIRMSTTSGEIAVGSPYNYCLLFPGYAASGGEPLRMGVYDEVKYFTWSFSDPKKLCADFGVSLDDVTDISINFKGTKNQSFEVWYDYGWQSLGPYNSVNKVYTVPFYEIIKKGYSDFSITSSTNYDTFSSDVEVVMTLKSDPPPSFDPPPSKDNISYGSDPAQKFNIHFPKTSAPTNGYPVLITVHGGNWDNYSDSKDYYDYMTDDIIRKGIVQVSPGYRGLNNGADCADMLHDIQQLITYIIKSYGKYIDEKRIGLLGWSAGGHLSMLYAYTNTSDTPIKMVISEAGPVKIMKDCFSNPIRNYEWNNLVDALCGRSQSVEKISPLDFVNDTNYSVKAKTYLFYGYGIAVDDMKGEPDGDGVVPFSYAKELCEDLNKKLLNSCELYNYKDLGHNDFATEYQNNPDFKNDLLTVIGKL